MADIQIKGLGTDDSALPQNGGNQNSANQGAQTGSSQNSQGGQIAASQAGNQVIATDDNQQTAAQTGNSQAAATTPTTSKKKAFDFSEEAEEAATTAPPEKYAIPSIVKEKFPDLVDLIKTTESMSDDERDYWFQILPIMTEDQIVKFRDILVNEKQQLAKLDNEYEEELNRLNEKHMIEWKEFEAKEKRQALTQAEQQATSADKQTEEDLLAKLSQI